MEEAISILQNGGVGVLPTDTLYGLVGSAFSPKAVQEIYDIKGRDYDKPFIILIAKLSDVDEFRVKIDATIKDFLMENWPGPFSVILPMDIDVENKFQYLHRGTDSLAFREPLDANLQAILEQTGPLVAPSANPQGEEPAKTIDEAKKYFGDHADFYIDGGELSGEPSTLIDARNGNLEIVRFGAFKLKEE